MDKEGHGELHLPPLASHVLHGASSPVVCCHGFQNFRILDRTEGSVREGDCNL